MTLAEMRTEFAARGFNHLDATGNTRKDLYLNRARARLDGAHRWPFLEDSVQGVAPLSIPTLSIIEAVSNETLNYPIELVGFSDLVAWGCDLSDIGSPQYAYRATPAGSPVVATWPTSTDTIGVQLWKVTADLSSSTDVPEAPSRFHGLIIDMAVQLAYRDSDNHQAAEALQVDIERQLAQMVDELIAQQEPSYVRLSVDGSTDW